MSRNFSTFTPKPYIGIPYSQSALLGPGAKVVPLNFDWLAYGGSSLVPNIIVGVNLQSAGTSPAPILDKVISV
jgi:hypothetical protein